MTLSINGVPGSIRKPGVYIDFDTKSAARSLPNNKQNPLLIGQRLKTFIEPGRFQGGTLNDLTSGGTFTGLAAKNFIVKIVTAAATDEFQYSTDGGATWSAATPLTGAAQALEDGVTITFGATTGHALDDQWEFAAWPEPTVAELVATSIFSDSEAAAYFGYGSHLHLMAKAAIRANSYLDLNAIALDDAGTAVQAAGSITINGPAAGAGSLSFFVGSKKIEVGIAAAAVAADIAISLQNEMARYPELPVTFAVDAATPAKINVTAKNGGLVGNQIGLAYESTASGVTATIVDMTGGAVDPDIDDALTAVFAKQYTLIASAYNDTTSFGKLKTHIVTVTGPLEQREGIGIIAMTGALADATTRGSANNSGMCQCFSFRGTRSLSFELAAALTSITSFYEDPALPLNDIEVPGIHAPAIADRFSRLEIESCLNNGVSPLKVGPGDVVQIVRSISTYVKDGQGVDDPTLLDISKMRSLFYVRKVMRPLPKKYKKATEQNRKALWTDIYTNLLKLEEGEMQIVENVVANKGLLVVEKSDVEAGRFNARIPADVIDGLHVFAAEIVLL